MYYGAIEAGGTKFVCAVGDLKYKIVDKITIPTTTPTETMEQVIHFFNQYRDDLLSIGIGSFGPIDINPRSDLYGYITNTPKKKWNNYNFFGTIKNEFNVPMYLTTDVNSSAYGEYSFRNKDEINNLIYVTIGTGVGGGAVYKGDFVSENSHPEMGHMIVLPDKNMQGTGICPYHNFCLEGLASGPAIENRAGIRAEKLPDNSIEWDIEANYIAQAVYNITYIMRPDIIVLGGGVMKQPNLIEKVREEFKKLTGDYLGDIDVSQYIVAPILGDEAAVKGCFKLAEKSIKK